MNGSGIDGILLPPVKDKTNGNHCYMNGAITQEADLKTRDEGANGYMAVPCSRLFVWSSHDQGRHTEILSSTYTI